MRFAPSSPIVVAANLTEPSRINVAITNHMAESSDGRGVEDISYGLHERGASGR